METVQRFMEGWCKTYLNHYRAKDPSIFEEDIISNSKITKVVKILQHISLRKSDLDAKGRAFEEFLSITFRGELGQFFTRRELVEFMREMLEPTEHDKILDPACGSGGFLLYSLDKVRKDIENNYSGDMETIKRKQYDFAHNNLFGIEINEKIARVAKMDMAIHDDAHTNIEIHTGLDNEVPNQGIDYGEFSLILTNPPFGDTVEQGDTDQLGSNSLDNFVLAQKKSGGTRKRQKTGILFLEACYKFLEEGGRLGIVLSDGILSNSSYKYRKVRKFIKERFKLLGIVSLPEFAFNYAESGLRTSLVFLEKKEETDEDYDVFMSLARKIGYDSTGRPDENELPEFAKLYEEKSSNVKKINLFTYIRDGSERSTQGNFTFYCIC